MSEPKRRQPWLRFYTADWRGDAGLRAVGFAARGLWMDMLSLMHEAVPYGHLVANERAIDAARLAARIGGSAREVHQLLGMLEAEGVFSRTADGTIYSRRMVRDFEKAERDRLNGKTGGNPAITSRPDDNPPDNEGGGGHINGGVNPTDKAHARANQYQRQERKNPPLAPPKAGGAKTRGRVFLCSDWKPNEDQRGIAAGLGLDADATALNFRDHCLAQGKRLGDLDAAWRLWCRVAAKPPIERKRGSNGLIDMASRAEAGEDVVGNLLAELEAGRATTH